MHPASGTTGGRAAQVAKFLLFYLYHLLVGIVVRMMEDEIGEDNLDALAAVTAELVIAVHRRAVRRRVAGRGEGAVLVRIAPEHPVARGT